MLLVEIKLDTGKTVHCNMSESTQISEHFQLFELANNKGSRTIPQYEINHDTMEFINMVEELRKWYQYPMNCSSCYRQEQFNKSCGGSKNSLHLKGLAFDWKIYSQTNGKREKVKDKWFEICRKYGHVPGINYYSHGYHLSFDESLLGNKNPVIRNYIGTSSDW